MAVGLEACLHLIKPLGFDTDERSVRRAGLDHWKHLRLKEHADAASFWAWADDRRVLQFSAHGSKPFTRAVFADEDVLLFGCESVGLPAELRPGSFQIPMIGAVRSLNLSNSVAVVCYEWARQVRPEIF